mmetsp:Transcript_45077/g.97912  ORF Transcript_45077/g.97912 Transcript_45077/m.97912 type:complete len:365 (+) Transcript_45077:1195-2289(+)
MCCRSAGNSPRSCSTSGGSERGPSPSREQPRPHLSSRHCPYPNASARCEHHERVDLPNVLTEADAKQLWKVWNWYQDDLTHPWYDKKPEFWQEDFEVFRSVAQKVVDAMVERYGHPMVLDQATVSSTNHIGHPPHCDNLQFDSVWWGGRQVKQRDELVAARGGAEVLWKSSKTAFRNYSATVALNNPWEYGGGDVEFYSHWGQQEPSAVHRGELGSGVAFCGCQRNIHAVTGVKWGWRLALLVWTRPPDAVVPEDQKHVCYFRPGTGQSIWLTTADLESYPRRRQEGHSRSWTPIASGKGEEDEEEWKEDWDDEDWNDEIWRDKDWNEEKLGDGPTDLLDTESCSDRGDNVSKEELTPVEAQLS